MVRFAPCLLVAAIAAPSAQAFSLGSKSAFVPAYRVVSQRNSDTALNMNLFDRFSRVAKSNLNNVLKNLEDPEKIMSQGEVTLKPSNVWVGVSGGRAR